MNYLIVQEGTGRLNVCVRDKIKIVCIRYFILSLFKHLSSDYHLTFSLIFKNLNKSLSENDINFKSYDFACLHEFQSFSFASY